MNVSGDSEAWCDGDVSAFVACGAVTPPGPWGSTAPCCCGWPCCAICGCCDDEKYRSLSCLSNASNRSSCAARMFHGEPVTAETCADEMITWNKPCASARFSDR